ncbi:MAG: ribosome small subunit-dependent GTPase A, partial [Cyanobacteria bacterium NC_groundwater_1444_Ag_S-0.65um_54_12]|nr:ribosome small subunit-dependent GTPase A [Cyanobacteria bacterium NC_groundwater_1444_Ag_S-0.65um_54_12]
VLNRPPIANVEQIIIIFSAMQPDFNPLALDRFLVLAALNDITTAIVINKRDLVKTDYLSEIVEPYRSLGYLVATASARQGEIAELRNLLASKVSVFAGPSGVGKSSLLNALDPSLLLKEAPVSEKSGRGRHTTTCASLYPIADGLVADTPGFSHLEFPVCPPELLAWCYPEMCAYIPLCPLSRCLHDSEPGCQVKAQAKVLASRQESYRRQLAELSDLWQSARTTSNKAEPATKLIGPRKRLIRLDTTLREMSRKTARQQLSGDLAALTAERSGMDETADA